MMTTTQNPSPIDHTYWEDLAKFITAYLDCALWSSSAEDETPLDALYEVNDIGTEWAGVAIGECYEFMDANEELLWACDATMLQHGHDFWLTRNGHGAGFWDRGYGEGIGRQLSDACKPYGEVYLGEGDMTHPLGDEERDAALGHP